MLLSVPEAKVPCGVHCTRKCFKPDVGFGGTVFASNEAVVVLADSRESIVQVQGFWSFQIAENCYTLLGYGVSFPYCLLESGQVDTQYWSGFSTVLSQPLQETIIFNVDNILRKVILHNCTDASFTVVDYMRQLIPKELTVPVFPEKNDMVLIQGERIGDIWFGHVHTVDSIEQIIEVYFFVPSQNNENIYIRETRGRGAKNRVQWNSVIGIAQGYWRNQSSWIQTES